MTFAGDTLRDFFLSDKCDRFLGEELRHFLFCNEVSREVLQRDESNEVREGR